MLRRRRLPEGVDEIARLRALVAGQLGEEEEEEDDDDSQVLAGIETGHGPWVAALVAAGYRVFPVNLQQSARFRPARR